MWSGCRAAGMVGSLLTLGGCITTRPPAHAAPSQTRSQPAHAASSSSSHDTSVGRRLRVGLSTAGMAVDGQKIGADQAALKAALGQADVVDVDIQADADAPTSLVLAALTLGAGPRVARRLLSWQDLKLEVSELHPTSLQLGDPVPASIFSWRANRTMQLWSISAGPAVANFGPYEPGDEKAAAGVVSNLSKACTPNGCSLDVELREERLQAELRGWQRIVAAVGSQLELHVRRSPPPPRNPSRPGLGRLPPEVIQSVVRLGFHLFKDCYEGGLSRNPNLQGRVSVSFVIERDGNVKSSSDGGSDIPDAAVRDCVVRQFVGFKFPAPETGIVTVVYPILLAPG